MKPTQVLPESYLHCYTLDSKQHKVAQGILIFIGFVGFFLCWQAVKFISPESMDTLKLERNPFHLIVFLVTIIVMILLHETIHGLVLWGFTKKFPPFGISFMGSVYVNASGWYLPRLHMLAMSLSPFFLISIVGIIFLSFTSGEFFRMTFWVVLLNAAGAINDLAVAGWLFFQPDTALVENSGQALSIYRTNNGQPKRFGTKEKIRVFMERYLTKLP
jgi:hypothetical protein